MITSADLLGRAVVDISEHISHGFFAGFFLHLHTHGTTDQLMTARQMQIIRDPRPVGQVGHR